MSGERAKLLCSFGGDFVSQHGKAYYVGGKTRLVSIERSTSFQSLLTKMSEVCDADPSAVDVKFQLPDGGLCDSRLVSVETDDDVRNMMEEFDSDHKIPIFLFTDKALNTDEDEEDNETGDADGRGIPMLDNVANAATGTFRETAGTVSAQDPLDVQNGSRRDNTRALALGPSMTGEMFRRESQSLVVGQEYEDVQTFRNALTSAAIAANFELHMIRSDQRRVTARCAADGCTWRVHASKLPQVSTFRIRTLASEHTCERSEDAGHRQATAKWIANCIRDKLRRNRNYKPREILNDIHQEYGVLITYKRAFLGREKALEELRAEPGRDIVPVESNYEALDDNNHAEGQAWGEIHDPPRKKRVYRPRHLKEARPLHCAHCNQTGHNRRTCTLHEPMQDETS